MKIGFASADWSDTVFDNFGQPCWGGSGWARMGQYQYLLAPHKVVVGTLCRNTKENIFGVSDWQGRNHFDIDILVMQRFMFEDVANGIPQAIANGQIILQDVDDWYWGLARSNKAWKYGHPNYDKTQNRVHYAKTLQRSTAVMSSTPHLTTLLSGFVKVPIETITNYVDPARFTRREHKDTDTPIVGWVGSTAHRSGDLEILKPVLPKFVRSGKVQLHHSGHVMNDPTFPVMAHMVGLTEDEVSVRLMEPPATYGKLMCFDIGIVPLTEIPFNRAKSYIKGLEYAAAGIPFIASPLDAYIDLYENYGIGRIAKKSSHWDGCIKDLMNWETRAEEAATNFERLAPFNIKVGAQKLREYFESFV